MAERFGGLTLGCVGAQSKAEGIGATLGNPRGEVSLLQEELEQSAEPGAPSLCPLPSPGHDSYLPFLSPLHFTGIQVALQ